MEMDLQSMFGQMQLRLYNDGIFIEKVTYISRSLYNRMTEKIRKT
ncbi:hypothetical protein GCM10008931_08970 [Oceanobacillus oncorhynchi subsp. oncorhynchi]